MHILVNSSSSLRRKLLENEFEIELKSIICILLYTAYGCVLASNAELHIYRTNESPYIFIEYGDYIFVCAVAMWCARRLKVPLRRKFSKLIKCIYEVVACIICTNIALKQVWTQLIEFSSIIRAHLLSLMLILPEITDLEIFKPVIDLLKSDVSERIFLTITALLVLYYVWESNSFTFILYYMKYFINKFKDEIWLALQPTPVHECQCSLHQRFYLQDRFRKKHEDMNDNDDLGSYSQYLEPINGPMLSD